jgi:hypothetical protein
MKQIIPTRPTPRTNRQQKAADTATANTAPTACDIALEGMIVLLARHISREMTSVDESHEVVGDAERQRISKIG